MNLARKHIVVADDQPGIRRLLAEVLNLDKYVLHEASSGEDVIEILEQQTVDLVFLDVKMPRMDGVMTLKNIRDRAKAPPVIMMTAQGQVDLGKRVMDMGATAYLEKPFDVNLVLDLVERLT
jgi:two-component system response regulator (stage 0 sporulation protein F)